MNFAHKIVTHLPLHELWCDDGLTTARRERSLFAEDIANLLRQGAVQFVVADIGRPLQWIPSGDCFDFWKREVQLHLASPESQTALDSYPGSYCYFASEWSRGNLTLPIVLLEKHH